MKNTLLAIAISGLLATTAQAQSAIGGPEDLRFEYTVETECYLDVNRPNGKIRMFDAPVLPDDEQAQFSASSNSDVPNITINISEGIGSEHISFQQWSINNINEGANYGPVIDYSVNSGEKYLVSPQSSSREAPTEAGTHTITATITATCQ